MCVLKSPNQNFLDGPKNVCSNQGRCNCGQCQCNEPSRISGKFCECDNESCDRYLSVVCAGNGRCECGTCKCSDGWSKSDCSCSTDTSSCVATNGVRNKLYNHIVKFNRETLKKYILFQHKK